ncbi:hypothetical protein H9636_14670 [Ureibacillus sp. Re31]|uniref:Uncharacterized protein n=2 Tax=Ureibacillus galli TaxID=2762222 RepID=A0ABR8XF87_9BACL|nr:hypothetical protein [Ureibacillus galli]
MRQLMNDRLMELLLKNEVRKLPENKKRLYQFIIDMEDRLVEKSNTVEEYLQLFTAYSPYEIASRHFNMPFSMIAKLMNEIEEELSERMEERCRKVRWYDYTNQLIGASSEKSKAQLFLFMN